MLTQTFFKLFPPPKFLNIPHAGLDICDDALRCIEYSHTLHGISIHRFGTKILSPGVIESGRIKDEAALGKAISELSKELKVSIVKVSLPEERMYLFKTEVFNTEEDEIRQNIESKLEENVPLSPSDAVFFFDLIPKNVMSNDGEGKIFASVSVAPLDLVSSYLKVIKDSGLTVLSFEIQPKAIARALVSKDSVDVQMIVHGMNKKTGIYIVCGGVVCFTSTIDITMDIEGLKREIAKVYSYWTDHGWGLNISRIILSGHGALTDGLVSHCSPNPKIPVEIGRVWQNAFSYDRYIPPVSFEDSLEYAIAAGLALPS